MPTSRIIANLVLVCGATLALALLCADIAHAQGSFVPLSPPPAGSKLGQLYGSSTLSGFLNNIFSAAIAIGAVLAVLRLAFAGYLYMTTDAWGQKGKAKEVIGDVILGLLLLLSIWLILRQINPQLLNLDALKNVPKLPTQQQTSGQQTQTYQAPPDTNFTTGLTPAQESQTTGGAIMP